MFVICQVPVCDLFIVCLNNTGLVILHAFTEEDSDFSEMQRDSRIASEQKLQWLCQFTLQFNVIPAISDIVLSPYIGFR
jgi:hypothetical protein